METSILGTLNKEENDKHDIYLKKKNKSTLEVWLMPTK